MTSFNNSQRKRRYPAVWRHLLLSAVLLPSASVNAFTPLGRFSSSGRSSSSAEAPSSQQQQTTSGTETAPHIDTSLLSTSSTIRRLQRMAMVGSAFDPIGNLGDPETIRDPLLQQPQRRRSGLSPLEVWFLIRVEEWYCRALSHKCPFLRRRATDFVETLEMLVRLMVIRPTNLPLVGATVSCRGDERTRHKTPGLSMEQLASVIQRDWKTDTHKGYYITGRLSPNIYRDDCFFDGPDPDMPIRGLRKFLNAASQLFDSKQSRCELKSLQVQQQKGEEVIVAEWTMNGVLNIPWRPKLPEVNGVTVYHVDEDGLIASHEETWDITAVDAFQKTAWLDFSALGKHSHGHGHEEEEVPV